MDRTTEANKQNRADVLNPIIRHFKEDAVFKFDEQGNPVISLEYVINLIEHYAETETILREQK